MNDARIASLWVELKSIHFANVLYWTAGAGVNRAARAEYFRRQNRVLEIRTQLIALNSAPAWASLRTMFDYIRRFLHDSHQAFLP